MFLCVCMHVCMYLFVLEYSMLEASYILTLEFFSGLDTTHINQVYTQFYI